MDLFKHGINHKGYFNVHMRYTVKVKGRYQIIDIVFFIIKI